MLKSFIIAMIWMMFIICGGLSISIIEFVLTLKKNIDNFIKLFYSSSYAAVLVGVAWSIFGEAIFSRNLTGYIDKVLILISSFLLILISIIEYILTLIKFDIIVNSTMAKLTVMIICFGLLTKTYLVYLETKDN